jgi:hypothetical protein
MERQTLDALRGGFKKSEEKAIAVEKSTVRLSIHNLDLSCCIIISTKQPFADFAGNRNNGWGSCSLLSSRQGEKNGIEFREFDTSDHIKPPR